MGYAIPVHDGVGTGAGKFLHCHRRCRHRHPGADLIGVRGDMVSLCVMGWGLVLLENSSAAIAVVAAAVTAAAVAAAAVAAAAVAAAACCSSGCGRGPPKSVVSEKISCTVLISQFSTLCSGMATLL